MQYFLPSVSTHYNKSKISCTLRLRKCVGNTTLQSKISGSLHEIRLCHVHLMHISWCRKFNFYCSDCLSILKWIGMGSVLTIIYALYILLINSLKYTNSVDERYINIKTAKIMNPFSPWKFSDIGFFLPTFSYDLTNSRCQRVEWMTYIVC